MEQVVLKAVRRSVIGKQVKALRRQGKLPGVIYGRHLQPIPILLDLREASRTLVGISPSTLVVVDVEGEQHHTLVRERQRDYIQGVLTHVDFLAVSMAEKLRASVPVELHGEAPAVKTLNAILVPGADSLEVECLPVDLPERIVVDVSGMEKIGDVIYVRDLVVSEKIKVLEDPDTILATITAPEQEEIAEAVAEGETAEPEVIERGKKEEEEF